MSDALRHPERVGPYHILQVIGEGGMGVVYEAEQREPVRRRVALKMMKVGLDTREVVGRFEAERQALAVMDHPGIAKVFDGGATDDGRPYFVMELVRGVRVDEYCDQRRLTTRQRAELFIEICGAVQHAHLKGVIHRDLKPGNVLVSEEGGAPHPKVIDFGVAKATGQRLTDQTIVTTYGQAIGTLAYMSPEQAEMSGLDVDTRADVYSLGIILYELLLGVVPVDPREVGAPVFLASLVQRDTPPPPPSRKLTALDVARRERIARDRRTDVAGLRRELSRDLQWIVLKAIEKDRTRRYDTAHGLSEDLRHYLDDEPVKAHPPSAMYRLGKLVRRNRAVAAMAAVIAALTVAYAASTAAQARRLAAERDRAEQEALTARRVSDFMTEIFSVSDPSEARGRSVTALEILERGRERVATELADEPIVQAALMRVMGQVYMSLGLYDDAEELVLGGLAAAESAVGDADSLFVASLNQLAWLHHTRQRYAQALPLAQRSVELAGEVWGERSWQRASTLQVLGMAQRDLGDFPAARASLTESLQIRRETLGPEAQDVGWSLYHLGWLTFREGNVQGAREVYEETIPILEATLDPDDVQHTAVYNDMAIVLTQLGEFDEAVEMNERILELRERTQGPEHPDVANTLGGLANAQYRAGDFDAALAGYERALAIREGVFGPDSPIVAATHNNIGLVLQAAGRYAEAAESYRTAIRVYEEGDSGAMGIGSALSNLGYLTRYVGDPDAARPLLERALQALEAEVGPEHTELTGTLANLGFLEADAGRFELSARYHGRAFQIVERTFGSEHPQAASAALFYGSALGQVGEPERGIELMERALAIAESDSYVGDFLIADIYFELGDAQREAGDEAAARVLFDRALEASRQEHGEDSAEHARWQARYWCQLGDIAQAGEWVRRMDERGYRDPRILRDGSFIPVRSHPAFQALAAKIRAASTLR